MSSPLIATDALAEVLGEVTVLDVRYRLGGPPAAQEYAAGHIPGAAYLDLDAALAAPPETGPGGRGRHPLPEVAVLEAALRAAGVRTDRPVVVYDDWQGRAAARAWWLLRWAGHRDVRVLDGGWAAWLAAGLGTATETVQPPEGDFRVVAGSLPVAAAHDLAGAVLVDARAPERFRGETEPVDPVAGHIPGAVNVPTEANLRPDGRFRDASELRQTYAGLEGAVVYCGSGVTACHDLLAMAIAGLDGVLYPDSWSGWITDPNRPVERSRECPV